MVSQAGEPQPRRDVLLGAVAGLAAARPIVQSQQAARLRPDVPSPLAGRTAKGAPFSSLIQPVRSLVVPSMLDGRCCR